MILESFWSPTRQVIAVDDDRFSYYSPINTEPSHDVAHLIVAASKRLLWKPAGTKADISLAEYNAVFIENLFDKAFNVVYAKSVPRDEVLIQTINHARWFVEKHYAPFPIPPEEAYRRFCFGVRAEITVRLFPHFYKVKFFEKVNPSYRSQTFNIKFADNEFIDGGGQCRDIQKILREILTQITNIVM